MKITRLFPTACVLLSLLLLSQSLTANELEVLPKDLDDAKPSDMMRQYLLRQLDAFRQQWEEAYEKRKSPEAIASYQKRMREACLEAIGGLPERTPLEAEVTGRVSRPGYHVEKILFQSQPKHYVTGLLFLPDAERFKPPYPGVLVPCGHSHTGKQRDVYQTMGALLALNGMAALVFDPIDQGERGQYLGEGGWPKLISVSAHINVGMGCILLGQNTARFEIWDAIRAVDYLQSREEVDPKRIGCTGCSGGGTQTSYLMALDDRIIAAAPSCYLTSTPRLLTTIGPQDCEQNIFGQLTFGLDHADWIMMRAPTPVLICAATKDFFDIDGTWTTFRYAKRLYSRLGFPERVSILEDDVKHSFEHGHRQAATQWMSRWLQGKDQVVREPEIQLLSEAECRCTPDGKVMSLPGARSVYDLNEVTEEKFAKQRQAAWATGDPTSLLSQVRRLTGIRPLAELPKPKVETRGTIAREGYKIEKLLISPEPGISLPSLLFMPEKPMKDRVVLYLHQQGKAADAGENGPIEQLVKRGNIVLAVELRGTGETQAAVKRRGYCDEFRDASMAYLLGRSYVGMRAEDVLVCARYAIERFPSTQKKRVSLIAIGNVGIPALHAAALEPGLFESIHISKMLRSWSTILHDRLNQNQMANVVHGALKYYDLPDLMTTLGERLTVEQPVDASGEPMK